MSVASCPLPCAAALTSQTGALNSIVTCSVCGRVTTKREAFNTVSVAMKGTGTSGSTARTLHDALCRDFTTPELLVGESAFCCECSDAKVCVCH